MKITFQDENCGYRMIFVTDWTFGRRILEICWQEMTLETFKRMVDKDNKVMLKSYEKIAQKSTKPSKKKAGHNGNYVQ